MNNRNGFDVGGLMVGSEGTLGIITRAVLRLLPLPEARRTVAAAFDDLETAGKSVTNVISAGIIPAKSEIIDNWVIRKSEAVHPAGLPIDAEAVILFETDGTAAAAETEAKTIAEICRSTGATRTTIAKTPAEAERYWTARRAGFAQAFSSAPTLLAEDVCVPIRHVPTLLKQIREISDKHGVITIVLGHMGDGNMHPDILTDADDPKRFARAEAAMTEIIETALSLGGVVSGEHGIGLEKKRFIEQALDPNVIAISRAIRGVFDPTGIMNPGKIWP
jgi:glycolate oxidase